MADQPETVAEDATAERAEEFRQSVTDEAVKRRVERLGHEDDSLDGSGGEETP